MSREIALVALHGMGVVKDDYFASLQSWLMRKLKNDWDRMSFKAVQYAPILQTPEEDLWRAMKREPDNDLDATKLRRFFLYGFGDAGSLEHSAHRNPQKYIDVQRAIQLPLRSAFQELGRDPEKPVVIVAQSLGCQVISNYLWDAGEEKYIFEEEEFSQLEEEERAFLKLKSLCQLYTTGCNIPLFVSGLESRECFQLPNPQLQWDNYYDPDDVLGWPMAQLGDGFSFVEDHPVNAGGLFTSWNPASHMKYWSDRDFLKPLTNRISQLLKQG